MSNIPRNEYPRPQMQRKDWLCLNGPWEFEVDQGDSGLQRGLLTRSLTQTILVPFCPESKLSGIENQDHLICVWYRKRVKVPTEWKADQILIHFQAVRVSVNSSVISSCTHRVRSLSAFCQFIFIHLYIKLLKTTKIKLESQRI